MIILLSPLPYVFIILYVILLWVLLLRLYYIFLSSIVLFSVSPETKKGKRWPWYLT